jgi:hypothetical protein
MRLWLLLVPVVLLAGACGGDDEEGAGTTAEAAAEVATCEPATSDLMTPLGNKVTLDDGRVGNGQMVQSEATPGIWFVAVELDGAGYEGTGDVATFATTNRFGGEAIYAVDELASEHTDWTDVADAEGVDAADPAGAAAARCVTG